MRQLTRHNQANGWLEIRERLGSSIVGGVNYFALSAAKGHMQRLDGGFRRRMRTRM